MVAGLSHGGAGVVTSQTPRQDSGQRPLALAWPHRTNLLSHLAVEAVPEVRWELGRRPSMECHAETTVEVAAVEVIQEQLSQHKA